MSPIESLASYQRCVSRVQAAWPSFRAKRRERLQQQVMHGLAAEKVAENILEDLFTEVLDWPLPDFNCQIERADIVLTQNGIKYLLIETKRPGTLAWHGPAVERALDQAVRYASAQRVKCVAISDGVVLYAAEVAQGGLNDRVFVSLYTDAAPADLWWLSVHGIYRPRAGQGAEALELLPRLPGNMLLIGGHSGDLLLHPKYGVPSSCFAYVPDPNRPATWKLPYRLASGLVDERRLPKAIQAILSNYRGAKVSGIPEKDMPAVLGRLAEAAESLGRMPTQVADPAPAYVQLADAPEQLRPRAGRPTMPAASEGLAAPAWQQP
jgi:hypothetical protein